MDGNGNNEERREEQAALPPRTLANAVWRFTDVHAVHLLFQGSLGNVMLAHAVMWLPCG